jgi:hypothetical protein
VSVRAGVDPSVHNAGEGGTVAGAGGIEVDCGPDGVGGQWVAESIEDVAEFLGGQQVEQHEHVGLFGQPIVVGAIAFCGQNEIEAAGVAVSAAIGVGLELGQLLVSVELADDPVGVERHREPAADLIPAGGFVGAHMKAVAEPAAVVSVEDL